MSEFVRLVRVAIKSRTFWGWIAASIIGLCLSVFVAFFALFLLLPLMFGLAFQTDQPASTVSGIILVTVSGLPIAAGGLVLSYCQWLVLKYRFSRLWLWLCLNTLSAVLLFLPDIWGLSVPWFQAQPLTAAAVVINLLLTLMLGLAAGGLQGLFFRGQVKRVALWVAVMTGCVALLTWLKYVVQIQYAETGPGIFSEAFPLDTVIRLHRK